VSVAGDVRSDEALQKFMAWAVFAFAGAGLRTQDTCYGEYNRPDRLR